MFQLTNGDFQGQTVNLPEGIMYYLVSIIHYMYNTLYIYISTISHDWLYSIPTNMISYSVLFMCIIHIFQYNTYIIKCI